MPGLFGIYAPRGRMTRGHLNAFLSDMAEEFQEPAWQHTQAIRHGLAVGLVSYRNQRRPSPLLADNDRALASAGSVLMIDHRPAVTMPRSTLNEHLMTRAAKGPESLFAGHIDGRFAVVSLEASRGRLTIGCDRFGLYPLYVCVIDGIVWFATRLAALVRPLRTHLTLDHDAIADYLAHRHFVGNRTFFKEINLVPEGTYLTFEGQELKHHRYWQLSLAEDEGAMLTGKAGLRRLRGAWKRAMDAAATAAGPLGVALSGGLDSRAIAAGLAARGCKPEVYTFGDPTCNDIKFARQTANRLGLVHRTTGLDRGEYMARDFELVVRRTDGSWPLNHAHLAVLRPLAEQAHTLYDGLTGGVLSIGKVTQWTEGTDADQVGGQLGRYFQLYGDEKIQAIVPAAQPFAQRVEANGRYYGTGGHTLSSSAAIHFSNTTRQRRFTVQNPRFLEGDKPVITPFWTIDYANACFDLAPRDRVTRGPFVELNRFEYPHLNPVPWTMTGLPITVPLALARGYMRAHEAASYANFFVKKYTGVAPLGGFQAGYALYFDWIRDPGLRTFIEATLLDPSVDRLGFLSRSAVEQAVGDHMEHVWVNHVDLIGSLLSTVLYFQTVLRW